MTKKKSSEKQKSKTKITANTPFYEENYGDVLGPATGSVGAQPVWVDDEEMESLSIFGSNELPFTLATTKDWPEFRTKMKLSCRWVMGTKVCVDLPELQTRKCNYQYKLVLKHPDIKTIKKDVVDCINLSGAAAIAILVTTGSVSAAFPVFQTAFLKCLEAKGVSWASEIGIHIKKRRKCGRWSRV